MVDVLVKDDSLKKEIDRVILTKQQSKESDLDDKIPVFDTFIQKEVERLQDIKSEKKKPFTDLSKLDDLFYRIVGENH